MSKKIQSITVSMLLSFALLGANVSTAFAAPLLDIHIEADEIIATSGEAFAASGPAVDSGIVCAAGTVDDLSVTTSGSPSGSFLILHVLKRFYCDDGSGTFDLMLTVRLNLSTHYTTARWVIVGGTSDYTGLHGNGSLTGTPINPGVSIHDVYDGRVN